MRRQSGLAATRAPRRGNPCRRADAPGAHPYKSLQITYITNRQPHPRPNVGLPPRSSRPRRYAANVGLLPRSSRSRDAPRPKGRNRDAHPARSAQSPWGRTLRVAPLKGARSRRRVGSTQQKKIAQRQPSAPPRRPCRLRSSADAEPFAGWPLLTPGCGGYARSCPGLPSRCAAKAAWRLRAHLVAAIRVTGRMHRGASLQVASNHPYNESPTSPAPNVGLPPRSSRPRRHAPKRLQPRRPPGA